MSSFKSVAIQYIQTTFSKCCLFYTQCSHTYGVFLDSIPSLCLFPSVASSACSRWSVDFACIIIIGAISVMHSCFIFQKYDLYCNHHFMYAIYFICQQSVNSCLWTVIHFVITPDLAKITTSSAVYEEWWFCLNFYKIKIKSRLIHNRYYRYVRLSVNLLFIW